MADSDLAATLIRASVADLVNLAAEQNVDPMVVAVELMSAAFVALTGVGIDDARGLVLSEFGARFAEIRSLEVSHGRH